MLKSTIAIVLPLLLFAVCTAGPVQDPRYVEIGPLAVPVDGDCSFRVNGDLVDPVPLFAHYGTYDWVVPNAAGVVEIANGAMIDMYCSNSFLQPFENVTKVTAQCLQNSYYLVDGIIRPFSDFTCTKWQTYVARRTGRPCNGGTDLLEVGFVVDNGAGFMQTLDICFDEVNEVTRYVHHVLNPASNQYQRSVARPSFAVGDFFEGKDVNNLYTKIEQNKTVTEILGMDASQYFNTGDIYMARGHMAAKVDLIFGAPQMSTFFFVNTAPQWQSFNGGNWERVESGVREFVAKQNLTTDCYTGVWGVMTLPDVNGVQKELYLAFDENNNGLIPVPKIYFRVVIDRETRNGIVIVGVNNPHATLEEIRRDYVLCTDIGHQIDWLPWAKEDLYKGYSYACTVPEFRAVVSHLPDDVYNVSGVLGVVDKIEETYSFL